MSWDWEKLHEQQQKRGDIPPQMEEFINRFNGFNLRGGVLLVILLLVVLLAASSVYIVNPGEEGVVQRFGRYLKTTKPGLHFKLPVGIEKVTRVNVQLVQTEDFSGSRISPVETDITVITSYSIHYTKLYDLGRINNTGFNQVFIGVNGSIVAESTFAVLDLV